ncbi:MAG: cytochrome c [Verrucomicrobia bacterium]|nr:cytochrome c [Verrucomicrobiota bacterium]
MKKLILITATLLVAATVSLRADVTENWKKNCASCHGNDGKGNTKAGKKAKVKDMTEAKYQEALTDEKMAKQIKEGMKEDGKEIMKPFGDKLTDDEIKALVAYVRKFKS